MKFALNGGQWNLLFSQNFLSNEGHPKENPLPLKLRHSCVVFKQLTISIFGRIPLVSFQFRKKYYSYLEINYFEVFISKHNDFFLLYQPHSMCRCIKIFVSIPSRNYEIENIYIFWWWHENINKTTYLIFHLEKYLYKPQAWLFWEVCNSIQFVSNSKLKVWISGNIISITKFNFDD